MKRSLMLVAALALFVVLPTYGQKTPAPEFSLKTSDGKTVQMSKLRGKVVVVNFWATWCGPCRYEIPDFIDVYSKTKEKGLEIVGISLDEQGWEVVLPFLDKNKINYPVVVASPREARKWGRIQYIPTTFIVDKQGFIVDTHTGVMTKDALLKKITPLL